MIDKRRNGYVIHSYQAITTEEIVQRKRIEEAKRKMTHLPTAKWRKNHPNLLASPGYIISCSPHNNGME